MNHYYYNDVPIYTDHHDYHHDEQHYDDIIVHPEPTFAGLGETCEGFNESTGQPYPDCQPELVCKDKSSERISLPGAGKKCVDPHAMMPDTETKPHEGYDPKLYPFLGMEFPFEEPEHVITDHAEAHYYAEPKECEPCKALKEKIANLEDTVEDLERKQARYASYPTSSYPSSPSTRYPSSSYRYQKRPGYLPSTNYYPVYR